MGFLLHHHQTEHGTRQCRCGIDVCCVQFKAVDKQIGKNEFKKFLQGLAFFYRDILTMAEAIEAQIRAPFLANTNSTPLNQAA